MVVVLFKLRARRAAAPFLVPLYPLVPLLFLCIYAVLLIGAMIEQPSITLIGLAALGFVGLVSRLVVAEDGTASAPDQPTA
jgi:hypothetical protein